MYKKVFFNFNKIALLHSSMTGHQVNHYGFEFDALCRLHLQISVYV